MKPVVRKLKMCKYMTDPSKGKCPLGPAKCNFYHSKDALERAKAKSPRRPTRSPSAGKKDKGKGKGKENEKEVGLLEVRNKQ